jgi:Mrp family chromosome partitioning ATPase/capsular polysaccharide biosynthesis protein
VQPPESPLRQYLQTLKRQAWLVALVPALTIAVAVAILQTRAPVYRASMTMVVGQPRGPLPPELGSRSVTRTMTSLLENDVIVRGVIDQLSLDVTNKKFKEDLKVSVLPDTSVMDVSYDSTNRRQALQVVSELERIFTRALDQTLGVGRGRVAPGTPSFELVVRIFDPPHLEPEPVARTATSIIFAGLGGLALGLLLGVGREALDSRIRGRKDAERWFGAPVIGTLPVGMDRKPPPGVGSSAEPRRGDEARVASLDLLRAKLQFSRVGLEGPTILVTSAGSDTGQSSVTATIGTALALGGKHVICIDADMREPRLHRSLGLENDTPGLAGVLGEGLEAERLLQNVDVVEPAMNGAGPTEAAGRLEVLTAGTQPSARVGMLTPEVLGQLIEDLNSRADYVVFDSPPLLAADALPLAIRSDNVLVVARSGRTTRDDAESVVSTLQELGVERIGVVLTDARPGT